MPAGSDLSIQKDGPAQVAPGDTFSYTIHVANAGPDKAQVRHGDRPAAHRRFVRRRRALGGLLHRGIRDGFVRPRGVGDRRGGVDRASR